MTSPRWAGLVMALLFMHATLRGVLDHWRGLLSRNVAEARPLLDLVLADRIRFTPTAGRRYQLTVPIQFDRVMAAAIPDLRGVQDGVASPRGTARVVHVLLPRAVQASARGLPVPKRFMPEGRGAATAGCIDQVQASPDHGRSIERRLSGADDLRFSRAGSSSSRPASAASAGYAARRSSICFR